MVLLARFQFSNTIVLYLDLDELLYAIHNEDVLVAFWRLANESFIASSHVSILESLRVGLVVIQVAEDNSR
jgi:hypothetical protein